MIYLDHNATTPIHPRAQEAMRPFLAQGWGNPSSGHVEGRRAKEALAQARAQVADLIGARPEEIVFESGGSEANNHAIVGTIFGRRARGNHVVRSSVEHPAVVEPCRFLENHGLLTQTIVGVDRSGVVEAEEVIAAVRPSTVLVTVMHANNETGALQPVGELARKVRSKGAWVHTDAAQSLGKVRVDVEELGVDMLTVVGHKLYGPKGVGALYVRTGIEPSSLIHGAGQEAGRRAGTENVLLAVGLGAACAAAREELDEASTRIRALRDRLHRLLVEGLGDRVVLNGPQEGRLPNTLNICIREVVGADVLARAEDVGASTGSACHEGQVSLSPVLEAMGVEPALGQGALRLTLGRSTTEEEVDRAARSLVQAARGGAPEIAGGGADGGTGGGGEGWPGSSTI